MYSEYISGAAPDCDWVSALVSALNFSALGIPAPSAQGDFDLS